MPRTPRFAPVKRRGRWWLNVPPRLNPEGKRAQASFQTREAAEKEGRRLRDLMLTHSVGAVLAVHQTLDAERALDVLGIVPGATLEQAAREFVARRRAGRSGMTLAELWGRFLGDRERLNRSGRYLANIGNLGRRIAPWAEIPVGELDRAGVRAILDAATPTPTQRNTLLRVLHAVLEFAVEEEWLDANPAARLKAIQVVSPPPCIATPEQMRLALAVDGDLAPMVAILGFAGVRPDELLRLEWADVDVETRVVRVPAKASKTNTARFVPMEPNLHAWISRADRSGGFVPNGFRKRLREIRRESGLVGLQDVFRHSYGSYWLAAFGDENGLKARMGHGGMQTFLRHYHRAVPEAVAREWWGIFPA